LHKREDKGSFVEKIKLFGSKKFELIIELVVKM